MDATVQSRRNGDANKLAAADRPVHEWYRFVLSYPPHLVRDYLSRFGVENGQRVLDPFCGTGTTLVECKKLGIASEGVEANPMAAFASSVKTSWHVSPDLLQRQASAIADRANAVLRRHGLTDEAGTSTSRARVLRALSEKQDKLLLARSISPLPLHKTLVLLDEIAKARNQKSFPYLRLALAKALVFSISNLHFGPEVGVAPPKADATVVGSWLREVARMAEDLRAIVDRDHVTSVVHRCDARSARARLIPCSIDAVITSPPYPNEKDYTRTTRLESVLLGLISSKEQLRSFKHTLVRSNTRNVYKGDDDDQFVGHNKQIQAIAAEIERRRISMGKTSGFERLYHKVAKLYFGGMARHLSDLRPALKPGARLAYVVGDQASYLRVMIRTGQILGDIAEELGYVVESIDLFRTRLATATREQLREEVVVLKWNG